MNVKDRLNSIKDFLKKSIFDAAKNDLCKELIKAFPEIYQLGAINDVYSNNSNFDNEISIISINNSIQMIKEIALSDNSIDNALFDKLINTDVSNLSLDSIDYNSTISNIIKDIKKDFKPIAYKIDGTGIKDLNELKQYLKDIINEIDSIELKSRIMAEISLLKDAYDPHLNQNYIEVFHNNIVKLSKLKNINTLLKETNNDVSLRIKETANIYAYIIKICSENLANVHFSNDFDLIQSRLKDYDIYLNQLSISYADKIISFQLNAARQAIKEGKKVNISNINQNKNLIGNIKHEESAIKTDEVINNEELNAKQEVNLENKTPQYDKQLNTNKNSAESSVEEPKTQEDNTNKQKVMMKGNN